jgi:sugar O-acyltransferase (sialic acid O-acetyltransferase NeuD family)
MGRSAVISSPGAEMNLPVIVLGGGGHAKVLIDTLLGQGRKILGYVDLDGAGKTVLGLSHLGNDEAILQYDPGSLRLVNGVGSIASTSVRKRLFEEFRRKGYHFESVIHPSAVIGSEVMLEEGVQIMARAVVQVGSKLGADSIINTGALIDHDCRIGAHAHVAPGAVLSGNVRIEDEVHVGAGAIVIQGLAVGSGSVIGAGAVVVRDVPAHVTLVGVPGKAVNRNAAG